MADDFVVGENGAQKHPVPPERTRAGRWLPVMTLVCVLCASSRSVAGAQEMTPTPDAPPPDLCRLAPRSLDDLNAILATPQATPFAQRTPGVLSAGTPADPDTVAGITATIREMVACFNAGEPLRVYGLYTDRYLRHVASGQGSLMLAAYDALATPMPEPPARRTAILAIRDVRTLVDGTAGAIVTLSYPAIPVPKTFFFTFVRSGDWWLIDGVLGEIQFSVP